MKGSDLRDSLISAANSITNNRRQVDALNVFPVPDGDTGTNMSMTMNAARRELLKVPDTAGVGEVANIAASALLRGARGNSGVILSLLFRGFAKGLREKQTAEMDEVTRAMLSGVDAAYKAVMKPTEGTILTVARVSAHQARAALESTPGITVDELWDIFLGSAEKTLESTPELLAVLKKAGVVDAGGKGLLIIYEGMASVLRGGIIIAAEEAAGSEPAEIPVEKNAAGEYEGEITFTYCTEFIVLRDRQRSNPLALRAYLESIGDSAVVVDDEEIIKCHVHTDNPGNALQKGLENGALTSIKIDNMREQHASKRKGAETGHPGQKFAYQSVDPDREYGFVSVAAGAGIRQLFLDLGVDNVVYGGQTMNPSTDDILEAIHATPAKNVIVLPNNKNIIMAAEQTASLADRTVYVLPTRTVPQGLSAMLAFDVEQPLSDNQLQMLKAAERTSTGQVTFAARDSTFDGHKIKKGEILALENGKLSFIERDLAKTVTRLTRSMIKKDSTFVTVLYGEDVSTEQAAELEQTLRQRIPETVELAVIDGGQPVYYYIISVE